MNRTDIINEVRETLTNSGFYVSELYAMRPAGFDLVARRDNSLLIIKVLTNIDAMTEDLAEELRTLSILLKGCPLIIGVKTGIKRLEDDVVYDRFGVQAINEDTLKNHLLEGMPLEVYAAPGGLYVNIDNERKAGSTQGKPESLADPSPTVTNEVDFTTGLKGCSHGENLQRF